MLGLIDSEEKKGEYQAAQEDTVAWLRLTLSNPNQAIERLEKGLERPGGFKSENTVPWQSHGVDVVLRVNQAQDQYY